MEKTVKPNIIFLICNFDIILKIIDWILTIYMIKLFHEKDSFD